VYVAATPGCAEKKKATDPIQIRWKKVNVFGLHFKNGDAIDAKAFKVWWVIIEITLLTIY
jgi:hypothetical protein